MGQFENAPATRSHMAHDCATLHAGSGREPEMDYSWKQARLVRCWTGQYFDMEHKLWAVGSILAPLQTNLDIFCGETDGDGTLGSQEGNPLNFTLSVNHTTEPHLPGWVSGNAFPSGTARAPLPLLADGLPQVTQ